MQIIQKYKNIKDLDDATNIIPCYWANFNIKHLGGR